MQMTTECEFVFQNTGIIIFCLIYSLNISHSTQDSRSVIFPVEHSVLISATFHLKRSGSGNFEKTISTYLFIWFYQCHGRRKYKRHSFIYRFQALNPNSTEYLRFINFYGKANTKLISWHSETWFVIDCLLENKKETFPICTRQYLKFQSSVLGADVSIEIHELLLLFSIISPWWKQLILPS